MNTALRPDFFLSQLPEVAKDKVAAKNGASEEERQLYTMSQTGGWKILNAFIEDLKGALEIVNSKAIEAGANFEEIGKNTVVVNMSKAVINRITTKVSDAIDACEKTNER